MEWQVARLTLEKLEEMDAERRKHEHKAMTVAVQNGVARAFKGK